MKKRKTYFSYSNTEHKTYLLVSLLLILFVLVKFIISQLPVTQKPLDKDTIAALHELQKSTETAKEGESFRNDYTEEYMAQPKKKRVFGNFTFDPNKADSLTLLRQGLSPKQARIICNYRRKGGVFKSKNDFKKMYGINDFLYRKIEPNILIDTLFLKSSSAKFSFEKSSTINKADSHKKQAYLVELNDADTLSLKFMKGIGSKLARRIISYRERLGGFRRKSQLLEVYGVDTTLYQQLEPFIILDTSYIKKININKAYFENIKTFPYLTRNQAIALVNYRNRHGLFKSLEEIKKCVLIDDSTFQKVKPYFVLNE